MDHQIDHVSLLSIYNCNTTTDLLLHSLLTCSHLHAMLTFDFHFFLLFFLCWILNLFFLFISVLITYIGTQSYSLSTSFILLTFHSSIMFSYHNDTTVKKTPAQGMRSSSSLLRRILTRKPFWTSCQATEKNPVFSNGSLARSRKTPFRFQGFASEISRETGKDRSIQRNWEMTFLYDGEGDLYSPASLQIRSVDRE